MDDTPKPELARKPEWIASFQGFGIYIDPSLSPGWVKFVNHNGEVIGMINTVGKIYIADKS